MKQFLKDNTGSAIIWAIFLILILITLSAIVYSGVTVYANYQACETELQRAATVSVDKSLLNANVRDLELDVPTIAAADDFYNNLTETGWTLEEGCWNRYENGRLVYSLDGMTVGIEGKTIRVTAIFTMPLPWGMGGLNTIHLSMNVRASVLYIE